MTEITSVPKSVAYLGPVGTFTEEAILTQTDLATANHVLCRSHSEVLFRTDQGEVETGFCAIENSIEGTVNVIQDTLAFDTELLIQREVTIPIRMNLLVRPGTKLADINQVLSYPHALAQVRRFIRQSLPNTEIIAANSTADAARILTEEGKDGQGAIANSLSAHRYGLEIAAANIEDHPDNETRFVLVARDHIPSPTGHDKISIVVSQRADRPGSLLAILQEFAARSINLTKLESRPTRQGLGDYCFFLDFEGHIADELIADCLRHLRAKQSNVKFLGSYPAAAENGEETRAQSDEAWSAADVWVNEIRQKLR